MIIAVDFDGCLCKNRFPDIGEPNLYLIDSLRQNQREGSQIILWTCRQDKLLEQAVNFCKSYGLHFDAVNDNVPEAINQLGINPRKVFAHLYIDDKSAKPYWNRPDKPKKERKPAKAAFF
jgi:hypothetical protein